MPTVGCSTRSGVPALGLPKISISSGRSVKPAASASALKSIRAKIFTPFSVSSVSSRWIVTAGVCPDSRRINPSAVSGSVMVPLRFDLLHLQRQFRGSQYPFAEQDIGEGDDPALVVGQLADHLGAERLDPAAFLLRIDDLVEVEHVGQRVAAFLPWFQHMVHALDGVGRLTAQVIGQPFDQVSGGCHGALPSRRAGTTPI